MLSRADDNGEQRSQHRQQDQDSQEDTASNQRRPVISREQAAPAKTCSFAIDSKNSTLVPCDEEEAISNRGEGSYWIDAAIYNEHDAEELHRSVIDKLDLSRFLRKHLASPKQLRTPQVLVMSTSALIVVRVLPGEETSHEVQHAVALCLKCLLLTVTVHQENSAAAAAGRHLSQMALKYMQQIELPESSTSGATVIWLMYHVGRVARALNELRPKVLNLYSTMESDVASIESSQITNQKDELLYILAVAEEQLQCVENVAEGDSVSSSIDFSRLKGSLGVLLSTAGSTERMAIRLEKTLAECRQMYNSHQQDRTNHHLAVLTIFSAVFMPITLMAGIWGMNFVNMPELERENGYYFALMSMALVAITLLATFYCLGWFK